MIYRFAEQHGGGCSEKPEFSYRGERNFSFASAGHSGLLL